jgi:hypothetical protein
MAMSFLTKIFSGVKLPYLIRAYILSAVIFLLLRYVASQGALADDGGFLIFNILSLILFPYAKLVWDEMKALLMGDNIFILPLFLMLFAKLFINLMLWGFAVLIAPLGILWVWYRSGGRQSSQHQAD